MVPGAPFLPRWLLSRMHNNYLFYVPPTRTMQPTHLLAMPLESIANHASSTPSHHPRTEPEYIPIMMRIIPRCPGKRLLDDDCGCNAKTKNLFEAARAKKHKAKTLHLGHQICPAGKQAKQKYTPSSHACPTSKLQGITVVLPTKLSKRGKLFQEIGQAAQAAAGHLVHVGSVLLGCKNLVCRCRSMLSPHSSRA